MKKRLKKAKGSTDEMSDQNTLSLNVSCGCCSELIEQVIQG